MTSEEIGILSVGSVVLFNDGSPPVDITTGIVIDVSDFHMILWADDLFISRENADSLSSHRFSLVLP